MHCHEPTTINALLEVELWQDKTRTVPRIQANLKSWPVLVLVCTRSGLHLWRITRSYEVFMWCHGQYSAHRKWGGTMAASQIRISAIENQRQWKQRKPAQRLLTRVAGTDKSRIYSTISNRSRRCVRGLMLYNVLRCSCFKILIATDKLPFFGSQYSPLTL